MTFTRRLTGPVESASISSATPTCFSCHRLRFLSNPFSPVSSSVVYPRLGNPTVVSASLSPLTRCTLGSLWQTKRLTGIRKRRDRKRGRRCKPQAAGWHQGRHTWQVQTSLQLSVVVSISHSQISRLAWLAPNKWFFKLAYKDTPTNRHIQKSDLIDDHTTSLNKTLKLSATAFPFSISLFKHKIDLHKQTHCCAAAVA